MAYTAERANPLVRSTSGGRVASAIALPLFAFRPPAGYGVLTTTGRRTGKTRRKCVRAIRRDDRVYLVSIPSGQAAWLNNIRAHSAVRLRIRGGTFDGVARELHDPAETWAAALAYNEGVHPCDYVTCALHRRGWPTRTTAAELIRTFFDEGIPLVVELRTR